jgi:molybdate transport system substrate-binding protein
MAIRFNSSAAGRENERNDGMKFARRLKDSTLPWPLSGLGALAVFLGLVLVLLRIFPLPGESERGDGVHVAVATNFRVTAQEIVLNFEREMGHKVVLSSGSTGKLFAQIVNGAPYEIFLSADAAHAKRTETNGLAVAGSRFTYARGRLVLYSADETLIEGGPEILKTDRFARLAIANPKIAPYGTAALDVLTQLGLLDELLPRIVRGENIAQTYQFVATGNAQLGFIALSQTVDHPGGSSWGVPDDLYPPILQSAVLLKKGQGSEAARAFLAFLKGETAGRIIARYGYGLD